MVAQISSVSTSYPVRPPAEKENHPLTPSALHAKFLYEIGTRWGSPRNLIALEALSQLKKRFAHQSFQIRAEIGEGTGGVVYKTASENGEEVALKMTRYFPVVLSRGSYELDPDAIRYDKRSGPIPASKFEDPNAITPFEMLYFSFKYNQMVLSSHAKNGDCLVVSFMEYFNGLNLESQLQNGTRFSDRQILKIICIVAKTLSNAHARGLIHQDVKPGNIVFNGEEVRLIDWDSAAEIPAEDRAKFFYSRCVGTPNFIAPDVERGKEMKDWGETDMYSLGWSCFQLLHFEKHRELGSEIFYAEEAKAVAAGRSTPTWHEVAAPRALQYCRESGDPVYIEVLLEGMWAPQGMRSTAMQVARYTQDLMSRLSYTERVSKIGGQANQKLDQ